MMKENLRIAIVSDLHIGAEARGEDLSPYAKGAKQTEPNYIGYFERLCVEQNLEADFLLVPGDLSNTGHPMEIVKAAEVISTIACTLKVSEEKVIFVPGNHDVDWYLLKDPIDDKTRLRLKQRYDALRQPGNVLSKSMGKATGSLVDPPYIATWNHPSMICIGFNTAWNDGPEPDKGIHNGLLSEEYARELQGVAKSYKSDERVKVLLVHHHPYPHPEQNYMSDYSMIQNADRILSIARENRIDFVVHGHKHRPFFVPLQQGSHFPTNILCAGSFSFALCGSHIDESNQFHLINIDHRDSSDQVLRGYIGSWAFRMGIGWDDNNKTDGLRYREPFGVHILPDNLKRDLKPLIPKYLGLNTHFKWSDVYSDNPDYQYVDLAAVKTAFEALGGGEEIEVLWIKKDTDLMITIPKQ